MRHSDFFDGVKVTIPLAVGAIVFGLTLGLSATTAGLSAAEMAAMSATVFAGASQLVAVEMIDASAPAAAIVAAVFAVNARHLLMGATIAPMLKNDSAPARWAALLLIVDESWALATARARRQPTGAAFVLGAGCLLWVCWMAATITGTLFGNLLPDPAALGLDFLGVAVFLGLLIIMRPARTDTLPFAVAAVLSPALVNVLPGSWNIITAALAAAFVGTMINGRQE